MYMGYVHLTLQSMSRLRSRTHILANVIEINKRSLPNSRLFSFIVLVLSARLTILTVSTLVLECRKHKHLYEILPPPIFSKFLNVMG